ncbi:hypothetical protein [Helicobacter pylori]|uniref:hypothetical protein n=1 Tax=Helicobacter pylori TaxID=210 RepID=UPI00165A4735|nr:hypothetical protein [Helicobacter pylori]
MNKWTFLSLAATLFFTPSQALEFITSKYKVEQTALPIYYPKLDKFRHELNEVIEQMKEAGNANYIFDRTSQPMPTGDFWWYARQRSKDYPMCSKTHNMLGGVRYEVYNKAYGIDPRDPKYHTYNQAPFKPFKIDYKHYAPTNIDFTALFDNHVRHEVFWNKRDEETTLSDKYHSGEYGKGDGDNWNIMCGTENRLFEIKWYLGNYPSTNFMYLDSVAWQFKNRPYENFLKGDRIIKIVHPLTKRVIFDYRKVGRISLNSNLLDMLAHDPDIRSMELLDYYVLRQTPKHGDKIVKIYNVRNIYPVMTYDERAYIMNYNQVHSINNRMAFIRMKYLVEAGILQFRRPIPKAELDIWFDENPEFIKDANYQFSPNYKRKYHNDGSRIDPNDPDDSPDDSRFHVLFRIFTELDDSRDLPDSVYKQVGEGKYHRYYEEKGTVVYFKPFGKTRKQIEKTKEYQEQIKKWEKQKLGDGYIYRANWFEPNKTNTTNTKNSTIETYYLAGRMFVVEISCKIKGVEYPKTDPHCYKLVKPKFSWSSYDIKRMKKICRSVKSARGNFFTIFNPFWF